MSASNDTTAPNHIDDSELRAQLDLVLEHFPRQHAVFIKSFPGWMRPQLGDDEIEDGESRTAFRERRLARDEENSETRELQRAWLAVHGQDLNDTATDAAAEQTKKNKGKSVDLSKVSPTKERPRPKQVKTNAPPVSTPSLSPTLMPPPPIPPRAQKRDRAHTLTDSAPPRKKQSTSSMSSLFMGSDTPAEHHKKMERRKLTKTKAGVDDDEESDVVKGENEQKARIGTQKPETPCDNCLRTNQDCYRESGPKRRLICSRCRVRKVKCNVVSNDPTPTRVTRPRKTKVRNPTPEVEVVEEEVKPDPLPTLREINDSILHTLRLKTFMQAAAEQYVPREVVVPWVNDLRNSFQKWNPARDPMWNGTMTESEPRVDASRALSEVSESPEAGPSQLPTTESEQRSDDEDDVQMQDPKDQDEDDASQDGSDLSK